MNLGQRNGQKYSKDAVRSRVTARWVGINRTEASFIAVRLHLQPPHKTDGDHLAGLRSTDAAS